MDKPSVIGGYKSGTLFDTYLLLFPDSTFYYSNIDKDIIGVWQRRKDTLKLKQGEITKAILIDFMPTQINDPRFNWLRNMKFVENNTPKVINFPIR